MQTTLRIEGMHCASCKTLIENVCKDIAGVTSCTVDVAGATAVVEHDTSLDPAVLIREISSLGTYRVSLV
ncbi:MAG: heavy metal-associated domain-containing protein [Patescibacteria group bacterium]